MTKRNVELAEANKFVIFDKFRIWKILSIIFQETYNLTNAKYFCSADSGAIYQLSDRILVMQIRQTKQNNRRI